MNIWLGDLEHFVNRQNFGYCRGIKFEMAKDVIGKMKKGR